MAQFRVYRNPNPGTRGSWPLLLDVQSDLIGALATRVFVPLAPAGAMKGKTMDTLTPLLEVEGRRYAAVTPKLAGVPAKSIGEPVADLSSRRQQILAALDLLFTGF